MNRDQRRKLGLWRSNNIPHIYFPLHTLHSLKFARPTFSLRRLRRRCTCGSRLIELPQAGLRTSFGASMWRTCKSHEESELLSHGSSSHVVSVPLWQRLTPLCSACETSNGCKKQVCFRHSGGMMWRLGNSRSERDLSPYKA